MGVGPGRDGTRSGVGDPVRAHALRYALRAWTGRPTVRRDRPGTPSHRDADPLLLRGGSARPARGGGARRGRPRGRRLRAPPPVRSTARDVAGVSVRRLGVQRHQGAGLGVYLAEYLAFFLRAGFALVRAHPRRRYGLVQVAHAARLPRLRDAAAPDGRRPRDPRPARGHAGLLREPLPFAARAGSRGRSSGCRSGWRRATRAPSSRSTRRSGTGCSGWASRAEKLTIVLNVPSLARFDPAAARPAPFMADGGSCSVYAARSARSTSWTWCSTRSAILRARRPELSVAPRAVRPGLRGGAAPRPGRALGIADAVTFHGRIPIGDVPAAIAAADVGLAPTRRDRVHRLLALDQGVRVRRHGPDRGREPPAARRATFGDDVVTYAPGDAADLATALAGIVDDPAAREARVARAQRASGRAVMGDRAAGPTSTWSTGRCADGRSGADWPRAIVAVRYAPRLSPEPTGHAIRTGSSHPMTFRAKPVVKRTHKAQWESPGPAELLHQPRLRPRRPGGRPHPARRGGLVLVQRAPAPRSGAWTASRSRRTTSRTATLAEQFRHHRGRQPDRRRRARWAA